MKYLEYLRDLLPKVEARFGPESAEARDVRRQIDQRQGPVAVGKQYQLLPGGR